MNSNQALPNTSAPPASGLVRPGPGRRASHAKRKATELDKDYHRSLRGPSVNARDSKIPNSYLVRPDYRQISLPEIYSKSEPEIAGFLERLRWSHLGPGLQACPKCGDIDKHYRCKSINGWKCKGCAKQFSVLSGTRLHSMKMTLKVFLSIALQFMEAKDGKSSRELAGLHGLHHQTTHVLTMKIREAIRETMSSEEPLHGYIQADAAYFMNYIRPSNAGTGVALAEKALRKNAGLDRNGKNARVNSPRVHALVVFVQAGAQGHRRYRMGMMKTEDGLDLLTLAQQYCTKDSIITTDQNQGYNLFSGEFPVHRTVNHEEHFQDADGVNTNFAENVFSRIRPAVAGAWHRMTVQNLIEYAWEVAWRQEMVGRDNLYQLEDLLRRLLTSGRPTRFVDYWHKRPQDQWPPKEEVGELVEIPKSDMPKRRGRPPKGSIRLPKPLGKSAAKEAASEASPVSMPSGNQPVDLMESAMAGTASSTVDSVAGAEIRTQDGDPVLARGSPPGA